MLSVIVCSRDPSLCARLQSNVAGTVGIAHEFIRIENGDNRYGICAAYNDGIRRARGELLLFVHEDVLFLTQNWGHLLREDFADPRVGAIGVLGSAVMPRNNCWMRAGQPHTHGHIILVADAAHDFEVYLAPDANVSSVVVLDGVFIAVRRSIAAALQFDEATFPAFDFYDADFSMRVAMEHEVLVDPRIVLKHFSTRPFSTGYFYHPTFQAKYASKLPFAKMPLPQDVTGEAPAEVYRRTIPRTHFPEE